MPDTLAGQVAVVTGGSRGIGRACVLALAAEGADVVVNYVSSEEAAEACRAAAEALGVRAIAVRADVGDADEARRLIETGEAQLGRVDILVNNAGIARVKLIHRMTREDWDDVIRTNLSSAFYCTQAVIPGMRARGSGRIVNVASMVGQHGDPGQANYAAAKGGMIALTKSAAKELARFGITVNALCPGYVDTDMSAVMPEQYRKDLLASIPLGRMATAEEIAASVVFLAGPGGAFYTGAELSPNGGQYT
jgi:NAD(P)-dependent dehydrogenase (short-subunit alcohol dehydrogenase family)